MSHNKVKLTIQLQEDQHKLLRSESHDRHISMGELLRVLIGQFRDNHDNRMKKMWEESHKK